MMRNGALGLSKQLLLGASAVALLAPFSANAEQPSRGLDGLYIGGHAGYGWGTSDVSCDTSGIGGFIAGCNGEDSFDTAGAIGGGQIGYNWRLGGVLLGIEGDIAFSAVEGDTFFGGKNLANIEKEAQSELDWMATLRGRAGVFATKDVLAYGTAGIAWGGWNDRISSVLGSRDFSTTSTGWTAGGGLEAIVAKGVSLKFEYLFVDFGDQTHRYGFFDGTTTANFDHEVHTVKIGLNFELN